ncbi:MAG: ComF family protein [Oscillospiraceae bacterium]|nr:ComF family protein [Oscillospiraceae bacterium]
MKLGEKLLQLLYPPRCLFCGEPVPLRGGCTHACSNAAEAARLAPHERALPDARLPQLKHLVCCFHYDDVIAQAVARFKFRGCEEHRFPMAQYLANDLRDAGLAASFHAVVWVPSWQSRSCHGKLLAKQTARLLGLPCMPLLVKTKQTKKQHQLSVAERRQNLLGAFSVPNSALVKARHILLIDDVLTTGSTLAACADTLLAAGAASVSAAVFSKAGQGK